MKETIISIVKHSKWIYKFYYFVAGIFLRILRMIVKPDDRLILFVSFGGRKFDDSPKKIYEQMLVDPRYKEYKLIWAFHQPDNFAIPGGEKIRIDTLSYFITALKARCWVTNSTIERGLDFKGKHTLYFNTWHGTPMKNMGSDILDGNSSFGSKATFKADVMTAQGEYEVDIFSRAFQINRDKFLLSGLPRNDELAAVTSEKQRSIRNSLGIRADQVAILYAPTYREYERDKWQNCVMAPPVDFAYWERLLGDRYVVLFRAHYEVAKVMITQDSSFVRDVSLFPDLNDLMIASDLLISDYSSVFFDYSILGKPMFYFTYDFDEYEAKRGLYFDIRQKLHGSAEQSDLLTLLLQTDWDDEKKRALAFRQEYVQCFGNAVKQSLDYISTHINEASHTSPAIADKADAAVSKK